MRGSFLRMWSRGLVRPAGQTTCLVFFFYSSKLPQCAFVLWTSLAAAFVSAYPPSATTKARCTSSSCRNFGRRTVSISPPGRPDGSSTALGDSALMTTMAGKLEVEEAATGLICFISSGRRTRAALAAAPFVVVSAVVVRGLLWTLLSFLITPSDDIHRLSGRPPLALLEIEPRSPTSPCFSSCPS